MIYYAVVVKTPTTLVLAESTDYRNGTEISSNKKYLKLLFRAFKSFPERCTLKLPSCAIHVVSSNDLSWAALCALNCPPLLAFGFLEEVRREFLSSYSPIRISSAQRPHSFVEFGSFLVKAKQRYNNPRSPSPRINLPDLGAELRSQPPTQLHLPDLEPSLNGTSCSRFFPASTQGTQPLPSLSMLPLFSIILSLLSASLSFYRGFADLGRSSFEEIDGTNPIHGFLFLFEGVLNLCQILLLVFNMKYRKPLAFFLFLAICCATLCFKAIRDPWISGLEISISLLSALCTAFVHQPRSPPKTKYNI